ncbi:MAG: methenyltetrahydromethanopterin cyclohydrolase [Candidatus Altiarchaeota archaeon]
MNLNKNSWDILEKFIGDVSITKDLGVTVLDFGVVEPIDESLAWRYAVAVAEVSLGGLGRIYVSSKEVEVDIKDYPAIACLGSQMSGWAIPVGGGTALGSGPARILAKKPKDVYERLGYSEDSNRAVLCLETLNLPDKAECKKILRQTGAKELLIAAYHPNSIISAVNVLARIVEMGVYRLDFLGYDAGKIIEASGAVPVPEFNEDLVYTANDAIRYGGLVELAVEGWDELLTEKCVSASSHSYVKPFKDILSEAEGDFYKIDHSVFAPAEVIIEDSKSNKVYTAGERTWRK